PALQKALDGFELAEGFKIELVAAEPLVADPVAMEIDEDGRMYVVEMHGYPLDLSGSGKIKLLKDTNGDGYPDQSVVFADSLTLPTGILRHKKGVIVTDAPNVWYLEDTDGDDRADVKRKLLSGFALSNPQHNLNSPVFGLDNWIYLAHQWAITPSVCKREFSDEGSEVHFPGKSNGPRLGRNADDRNVRFKPDSYQLEALAGESQFGQTFDDWGHQFLVENAQHAYHEVLAARYLKRNPRLLLPEATRSIPDHGDACEVFPITSTPSHQLLTDVGVMTSACGITWYNGGAFPKPYDHDLTFVAEPVHNLVHVDKIKPSGVSFVASRVEEKKEFLASKDAWFRPVNFYVGPEGALYVVDYYRQIVEHPEWMSDEVNRSGQLYNGQDKGRIYRIVPKDGLPMDWLGTLKLSKKTDEELVALLENKNGWWRKTAQRLLFERKTSAIEALRHLAHTSDRPESRVQALCLLDGLGKTNEASLTENFTHPQPGVRETVVRISETHFAQFPNLEAGAIGLAADDSPQVRFQVLNSLGYATSQAAEAARLKLTVESGDRWMHLAGIAASPGRESALLRRATTSLGGKPSESNASLFTFLAATIANGTSPDSAQRLLSVLDQQAPASAWWQAAVLRGLKGIWEHREPSFVFSETEKSTLLTSAQTAPPPLRRAALDLLSLTGLPGGQARTQVIETATRSAQNPLANPETRVDALALLALANPSAQQSTFETLLNQPGPLPVRLAALESLGGCAGDSPTAFLVTNWKMLPTPVQERAIDVFLENPKRALQLLDAVAINRIASTAIGWRRTVRLMNHDDPTGEP
ncbi:MAG: dehydrogenase, partial [Sphingobacteriaceae bacterium]|nr:dehydrogenase [Cytophagaceae bacterium]